MSLKSLWRVVRRIWVGAGVVFTIVFVTWSLIAYRASPEAIAALGSDSAVSVEGVEGGWRFTPAGPAPASTTGLLFFPGALVDPAAYAPLARAVAREGYPSVIMALPRRGAFGGAEDPLVRGRVEGELRRQGVCWVLGGHSRGGVVASRFAADRPGDWAGLVLIGTSHPRDVDLSALAVPVTKIVGTRDGLASRSEVEANRALVPAATRWVWVEGGNHSQFGWYGWQPGDRRPRISAADQRARMIGAVLETLRLASQGGRCSSPR